MLRLSSFQTTSIARRLSTSPAARFFLRSRAYHGHTNPYLRWPARRRALFIVLGTSVVGSTLLASTASTIRLDTASNASKSAAEAPSGKERDVDESLFSLARAYVVYSACSIPALVDNAPTILGTLQSIPIVRNIASAVIRYTFFDHVGSSWPCFRASIPCSVVLSLVRWWRNCIRDFSPSRTPSK